MLEPTFAVAPLVVKPVNDLYDFIKDKISQKLDERAIRKVQATLAERIESVQRVKTIYKGDSAINLKEFYYPTKVRIKKSIIPVSYIGDISAEQNLVLQGTVGQGKSIFMRFMTSQEIRKENRIPVFFELRNLHKNETLEQAIITTLNKWLFEIDVKTFKILAESGKLVFFLDGFDEIPSDQVKGVIRELEYWSEKYPLLQVIISSRPDSGIEASAYFDVIKLAPYDTDDQLGLIKKLIEDDESFIPVKKAIEASSLDIQNLLKTPLMVTLFVMTYRAKQIIPESMSDFYEDIFQVLMHRHDKTKPGFIRELKSSLNEKQLQEVFEYFCFLTKREDLLSFNRQMFLELIKTSLKRTIHNNEDPSKVLLDITRNLCLITQDGLEFSFIHKSIQEFFVSNFIKNRSEEASKKAYELIEKKYEDFEIERVFLLEIDKYRYYKYFLLHQIDDFIQEYDLENHLIQPYKLADNFFVDHTSFDFDIKQYSVYFYSAFSVKDLVSWMGDQLTEFTMSDEYYQEKFEINAFGISKSKTQKSYNFFESKNLREDPLFLSTLDRFIKFILKTKEIILTHLSTKEDISIFDEF